MGSRVILADDSVTIQKVVGIIFANEGYELTVVASGDEAIARARELNPDVMLVDALMPGKNGYEVCREIRQDPALAHTAILLMTGAFETIDEEKGRQSGADEFITKPFESQALIEVTNRLIALTAARKASPQPVAAPPVMPPPQQVAAAPLAPPPLMAAAPAPPPVAAPEVDDIWATGFDDEPVATPATPDFFAAAAPVAPAVTAAPAPVKATTDDDIWGAFDMDAIETKPAPVAAAPSPAAASDDIFSFETTAPASPALPPAAAVEDEFVLDEVAFDEPAPAAVPLAAPSVHGFEPVGEEEIFFGDDEPLPTAPPAAALPVDDAFGDISFDEPEVPVAAAQPVMPVAPTPVEPPAPVFVPPPVIEVAPPVSAAPAAPTFAVEPPPVAAPAPVAPSVAAAVSLDEEQLKALLSKVSRDVIERIVWEVVPDLAESIIKEEIRKLKAGIA
jgi:CheY-like chemotaxis protein